MKVAPQVTTTWKCHETVAKSWSIALYLSKVRIYIRQVRSPYIPIV